MDFKEQLVQLAKDHEAVRKQQSAEKARQEEARLEQLRAEAAETAKRSWVLETFVDPVFTKAVEAAVAAGFEATFDSGAPIGRAMNVSLKGEKRSGRLHAIATAELGVHFSTTINGIERRAVVALSNQQLSLETVSATVGIFFDEALKVR